MRNGMASGYPYTSIMDSAVNLAQLAAISFVSGVPLENTIVQGDDVATNIATREDALKVISISNALGGKMNAAKILYRNDGSVDFLRTMFETPDKTAFKFLARSLASAIYHKPWSSSQKDPSSIDVLSAWQMIYSRGGKDPELKVHEELMSTTWQPKLPK